MRYILKNKLDYILRYIVGTALLIVSLLFVLNPENAESFKVLNQPDPIRHILGWTEAAFCVLFIFYRTHYLGAFGLFIVFAFAAYLHLKVGIRPYGLIGWTVGILFVLYCDKRRKATANKSGVER
jgi:hypothetical protein